MVIVLLDEMNLAGVEYYFSEFFSKLETRRNTDDPNLQYLKEILASIGDQALTTAFDKACKSYQFQWKGLVYP